MIRLEALADALTRQSNWFEPDSHSYQNRNPGLLRTYAPKHLTDDEGVRVFDNFGDGYQALLFDLTVKCSGHSRTKLKPHSTLHDLVMVYGHGKKAVEQVVRFLRRALRNDSITYDTQLSFFLTNPTRGNQ
jgi:hypothetical protein